MEPSASPAPEKPRTKIVATVGPACAERGRLLALALQGVSVFRLNFSHGDHDAHAAIIDRIRSLPADVKRPLAILADLSGPKLRVGEIPGGARLLQPGELVRLSDSGTTGDTIAVNIEGFHRLARPGQQVRMDDGMIDLVVTEVQGTVVTARVLNEEAVTLKSRKGVNLPGAHLPIPALTNKDREDLRFALEKGVDFVALSFVRSANDLAEARAAMDAVGICRPLVAKIEQAEALDDLESIIDSADAIMVARGDLGIEIPVEKVPSAQQRIIRLCNESSKPVITATQMLDSMIERPLPTRAEVTDIYNAIHEGTDAVMLSGETAVGLYPEDSVRMMRKVALEAEREMDWSRENLWFERRSGPGSTAWAVTSAAAAMAGMLELDAIVCPTQSGRNAMRVARLRPACKVVAFSTNPETVNRLCLIWGVQPRLMKEMWGTEWEFGESDAIVDASIRSGLANGVLSEGMRVVVVAGVPLRVAGVTNFLRVVQVGSELEN